MAEVAPTGDGSVGAQVQRCVTEAREWLELAGRVEGDSQRDRIALAEAWMKLAGNLVCFKPELEGTQA